ncbi:MAG: hypothetical protein Kow0088_10390 [Anaerolineales bacterium]
MERRIYDLNTLRRSFDTYQDEPFVTSLNEIDAELDSLRQEVKNFYERYVQYRQWLTAWRHASWRDYRKKWNLPALGRLGDDCRITLERIHSIHRRIEKLDERFEQIREFPWSIALQVREVIEYLRQAKTLISELATYGICGDVYEALINRVGEIEAETKQVPVYFLSEPYEKLLAAANQQDVSAVYQIVQKNLPAIISTIQQADRWKNEALTLEQQSKLAQIELARTEQMLAYFPDEVDRAGEKEKMEAWKQKLDELIEKKNNLEADRIAFLANEFGEFIHEILTSQQLLRQNRQRFYQYRRFMQANANLINQIRDRLEAISNSSLKLEWNVSGELFDRALEDYRTLQSIDLPYSFSTLEKLVKESTQLQSTLIELDRQTGRVAEFHQVCEKLINAEEINDVTVWVEAAKKLSEAIRPFDPRNFPNREWVFSFDHHLQELESGYRQLSEKLDRQSLPESLIETFSGELEMFYRQSLSFREQMNVLDQVLRNLLNNEKQGIALLKTARNQFAQITMFVLSQPLLAEKAEKEIVQYDRRFDLCEVAFRQREKDTLARKQAKLQQLISDIEQAANRWMSIVESDCLKMLNDLEQRIDRLDQIAQFEDALLYRAKEILVTRNEIFNFRRTARVNLPLDQIVGAMKKVFDLWQESFALSKQIAEQVEAPLLSVYQEFQGLQKNVHAKYLELEKLIPAQRRWPPNSLLLTVERNEMAQLDEKWSAIQTQPISVIQLVKTLSELSGSYKSLLEKFLQYEQWARQEQARIERIEADIYRLDRLWEIQQRRYSQVPEIEGQIRDLRQETQKELTSLHQYWLTNASRRPPSVDYDVVLRKLIELSRHLANARIVIFNEQGGQELMDINGQVIQKTQGQRMMDDR